jgi:hypothetical protein
LSARRPLQVPSPQYFFMQTSLLPLCLRASISQHISRPLHTHCLNTLSRPLKALSWSLKVPHGLYQPSNGLQITLRVFVSIYTASTNTIGTLPTRTLTASTSTFISSTSTLTALNQNHCNGLYKHTFGNTAFTTL